MSKLLTLAVAGLLIAGIALAQQPPHHHGDAMASFAADAREAFTATPAFGPDGSLWLARGIADRMLVSRSTDLGKTFSAPVPTTPGPVDMDWGPDSRPQIAVGGDGGLLVSWAIFQDKRFNGRVYFARSSDNGASFAAARPITPDGTSQRFQTMAIDAAGRLFAAWLDKRDVAPSVAAGRAYPGAALAYAWADDISHDFSDTHIALDNTCECCRIAVAFAAPGRPVLLFRNVFDGHIRDHAVVTFDNPTTPGPLQRVSLDNWRIDACPHQGPSLAIARGGSYHAAWFSGGGVRQGLFYARAAGADAPFGAPRALSSPDHHPARPYLLAHEGTLHLVWKEFDGSKTRVVWQASNDDGLTWSIARAVAETADASDHPLLVADKAHVYLSWLTKSEGYRLVPLQAGS